MDRSTPVLLVLGPSAGGIRRHVAELADRLEARGRPVVVAAPAGVLEGLRRADHVVEIPELDRSPIDGLSALRRARQALRLAAADVGLIHAHGLKAGWLAVSLRPRPPVVVTVHNLVLAVTAGAATPVLRALEGELARRVERTVVVSAEMARRFTGSPGADRVRVVAPVSPLRTPSETVAATRQRLGAGPGQPLAVCVARLHPQKGVDVLLGAAALARRRLPALRIAIVGEGPLEAELRRQAQALDLDGTVVFAGPSSNAADELAAADVVVVPSRWEGWPLVVAEALRLERPVVASEVGAVPEMVVDQVSGSLVPPGDALALAGAVESALADRPRTLALAVTGGRLLAARYPPELLVDRVEAVYEEALGSRA